MDMRSISFKKHEWVFANMVDQKRLAYHRVFFRKSLKSWNLDISWKSENNKKTFF